MHLIWQDFKKWPEFRKLLIKPSHMKQLLIIFIGVLFSSVSYSQEIVTALKNGNAAETAAFFDNSVEITIGEKSSTNNKKNGEVLLRNFFAEVGVKNFEVIHKSGSSSSQYYIGNLSTNSGVYRTTIFMKQKGSKNLVQEIRFEK